jgi:(E)-4-hydroxy-3-methylbut-2-enyl-diphosphate synthase
MKYCENPFFWKRRITREVKVGNVSVGGNNPIRVQTMLTSDTMNTAACVAEAIPILEAGCEILRITAPSINDSKNLKNIVAELRKRGFNTPIVADIHFVPAAAMEAAEWCEKVRINPGNYADRKKFAVREYSDNQYEDELKRLEDAFTPLVLKLKKLGRALRIGTNHGSLSDRIMNRYGDSPLGMVESALEFVRVCRKHDYHEIILSMKASNPKVVIEAYRLLVARMDQEGADWNYPLHLGVTEAGEGEDGRIKSAIGIGALLEDGIGDTVRVSLTEDSVHEIPVCRELVKKYNEQKPATPAPLTITEKRDPYSYTRRPTNTIIVGGLRIGGENPPRVELPVPLTITVPEVQRITTAEPDTFAEVLQFSVASQADVEKLKVLRAELRKRHVHTPFALRLEDPALAAVEVADKINIPYRGQQNLALPEVPVQFDVEGETPEAFAANCVSLAGLLKKSTNVRAMVSVGRAGRLDVTAAYRVLAATMPDSVAILLRDRSGSLLTASTNIGGLLCDGIGDAVEVTGQSDALASVKLAYNILQSAGTRTFKTDYVACPSCGRTLFDLQTVTARIKGRTAHLKGVKLAIMGCIVNGPGEMADADFGYVGTAPGKISLWVGKTQVKQHIPEAQAVDELVALIKEHGKWTEPSAKN